MMDFNTEAIEDKRFERVSYVFEAETLAYEQLTAEGVKDKIAARHDDGSEEASDRIEYLFGQEVTERAHELFINHMIDSYSSEELALIRFIKVLYDDFLKEELLEKRLISRSLGRTELESFIQLLTDDYDDDGLIESLNLNQEIIDRLGF